MSGVERYGAWVAYEARQVRCGEAACVSGTVCDSSEFTPTGDSEHSAET